MASNTIKAGDKAKWIGALGSGKYTIPGEIYSIVDVDSHGGIRFIDKTGTENFADSHCFELVSSNTPTIPVPKFKVGDVVRCVKKYATFSVGETRIIRQKNGMCCIYADDIAGLVVFYTHNHIADVPTSICDYFELVAPGNPIVVKDKHHSCQWKTYTGIIDTYSYCTICDKKKDK